MAYTVLARRYRSTTFDEVVGLVLGNYVEPVKVDDRALLLDALEAIR